MKAAVITFPGSNCDRDLAVALERAGADVVRIWHKDDALPAGTDLVAVPGRAPPHEGGDETTEGGNRQQRGRHEEDERSPGPFPGE